MSGALSTRPLAGSPFGLELLGVTPSSLRDDPTAASLIRQAFSESGGLLLARVDPVSWTGADMVVFSAAVGEVESAPADGSYEELLPDAPAVHAFSKVPSSRVYEAGATAGSGDSDGDYYHPFDPETGAPAWHTVSALPSRGARARGGGGCGWVGTEVPGWGGELACGISLGLCPQDQSFRSPPPLASAMYCVATPASSGDTLFASTTAAFDALSPQMRQRLEGLHGVHNREEAARTFANWTGERNLNTGARPDRRSPVAAADSRLCWLQR